MEVGCRFWSAHGRCMPALLLSLLASSERKSPQRRRGCSQRRDIRKAILCGHGDPPGECRSISLIQASPSADLSLYCAGSLQHQ